eukprot:360686-Chlamydomonas_euryale.AAC.5
MPMATNIGPKDGYDTLMVILAACTPEDAWSYQHGPLTPCMLHLPALYTCMCAVPAGVLCLPECCARLHAMPACMLCPPACGARLHACCACLHALPACML